MYALLSLHTCNQHTQSCPHCGANNIKRHGTFYRHEDSRRVPGFYCKGCKKTFSRAGYSLYYRHQYRHYTEVVRALFANGCTIRGIGRILKLDKDTVARRLVLLAQEAREKYGKRPDESVKARDELLCETAPLIEPTATIVTDQHKQYPPAIKRHFPQATHVSHKSLKGAVVGQGELKKVATTLYFVLITN